MLLSHQSFQLWIIGVILSQSASKMYWHKKNQYSWHVNSADLWQCLIYIENHWRQAGIWCESVIETHTGGWHKYISDILSSVPHLHKFTIKLLHIADIIKYWILNDLTPEYCVQLWQLTGFLLCCEKSGIFHIYKTLTIVLKNRQGPPWICTKKSLKVPESGFVICTNVTSVHVNKFAAVPCHFWTDYIVMCTVLVLRSRKLRAKFLTY